jgi:uncharacterized protein (TIGR00255 family)
MTGYAYNETQTQDVHFSVEIKSYNARFLDMSIYLPPYLGRLENRLRQILGSRLQRGKIEVNIKLKHFTHAVEVSVDTNLASSLLNAFKDLSHSLGISDTVPLSLIAEQPGVISIQDTLDIEYYWNLIHPLFESTLGEFILDRKREGDNLKKDILTRVDILEQSVTVFKRWQNEMESDFKTSIKKRFNEALGNIIDEQRVLTETAVLLVKFTISEEITRLKSHLDALKSELDSAETPGRKIDFICQELNREINTIGSKNQHIEVGKAVICAKDALESIREQTRNIE